MTLSERQRELHRKMAANCFNLTWELLEKKRRTGEEDLRMLHLTHASRYHWGIVGNERNFAIGDWQVSRVYAALKEDRLTMRFARSSLQLCEENGLDDILPSAFEAVARAYAVEGDWQNARRHLQKARLRLDTLGLSPDDKRVYVAQIKDTEALIES